MILKHSDRHEANTPCCGVLGGGVRTPSHSSTLSILFKILHITSFLCWFISIFLASFAFQIFFFFTINCINMLLLLDVEAAAEQDISHCYC